jgi:hypothetical protein
MKYLKSWILPFACLIVLLVGLLIRWEEHRPDYTASASSAVVPPLPPALSKINGAQDAWRILIEENAEVRKFQESREALTYQQQVDTTNGTFFRLQSLFRANGYDLQPDSNLTGFSVTAIAGTAAPPPPAQQPAPKDK